MHDLTNAVWRTSSRSSGAGQCVEVADNLPEVVAIRDSKDRTGPVLTFGHESWSAFVTSIHGGGFALSK
jgi:Domain of unknown function (DUF397)